MWLRCSRCGYYQKRSMGPTCIKRLAWHGTPAGAKIVICGGAMVSCHHGPDTAEMDREADRSPRIPSLSPQPANRQVRAVSSRPAEYWSQVTSPWGFNSTGGGDLVDRWRFYSLPYLTEEQLRQLYVESFALQQFVNVPIEDATRRGREFTFESTTLNEELEDLELDLDLWGVLAAGWRNARLFGGGFIEIITREAAPTTALQLGRLREGDLIGFQIWSREETTYQIGTSPRQPSFRRPETYFFKEAPREKPKQVHASRVIRFDGLKTLERPRDNLFALSEAIPMIHLVIDDQRIRSAAAHLAEEKSIGVLKTTGWKDAISASGQAAGLEDDEISPAEYVRRFNEMKSVYKTASMDLEDDFSRVEATVADLPGLMNSSMKVMAAAADIPLMRFEGSSPLGFSNGDQNQVNYILMVESQRARQFRQPLRQLDPILARTLGLGNEKIEWEWKGILETTQLDRVERVAKINAIVRDGVDTGLFTIEEGRNILKSEDDLVGPHLGDAVPDDLVIPEQAPDLPDEEPDEPEEEPDDETEEDEIASAEAAAS